MTTHPEPQELLRSLAEAPPSTIEAPLPGGTYKDKVSRQVGGVPCLVKYAMADDQLRLVRNEVAAYRVDQVLGLGMVPVTVLRWLTRPGHAGRILSSVQAWVDDADGFVGLLEFDEKATSEAAAFDWLIENRDRNPGNILKTGPEMPHGLVLIDHERAFGVRSQPRTELWGPRRGDLLSDEFLARVEHLAHVARYSDEFRDVLEPDCLDQLANRADALVSERRVPMNW